ncbi:MAG: ribosome recycling factor [Dehalococcoidia bacterium]|nr:ribosome recycling factor [Dehalococcoidia bacterium]
MINDVLADARDRMGKAIEATRREFGGVRTGRANPSLVENIKVDYYGTPTLIKQLANINVPEARLLTLQVYDKGAVGAVEKALRSANLGLNPANDGNLIRLAIPQLTEQRRKELVKMVHGKAEEGRVSVRNVRRDAMERIRQARKDKEVGEDDEKRAEGELQKLTDQFVKDIDRLSHEKEAEVLEV